MQRSLRYSASAFAGLWFAHVDFPDLRVAGNPGNGVIDARFSRSAITSDCDGAGSRAKKLHLTAQDIHALRQFIDLAGAQQPPTLVTLSCGTRCEPTWAVPVFIVRNL